MSCHRSRYLKPFRPYRKMVLPSWSGSFTGISTLKFSAELKKKKKKKEKKKRQADFLKMFHFIFLFFFIFSHATFCKDDCLRESKPLRKAESVKVKILFPFFYV